MAEVEYACRWTDWEDWTAEGERKTRVRYDRGGYGDTGRLTAGLIAAQTRAWQPHHGLPADAVVVARPIGQWSEVPDA